MFTEVAVFAICITPKLRARLYQHGQPVAQVNEDRLKDWVEQHYPRPWPPRIDLDERAALALCEYLRQFA